MIRFIYPLLIVCLFACRNKIGGQDQNVTRTREMFEAFNRHNWQAMANYYSQTASFLDPSFGTAYVDKTREETVAKYAEMEKMFPDVHDEIKGIYPSEDKVIVEFIASGTGPDSVRLKLLIISVLTFKDGLIVKDATYYDNP